MVTKIAGKKWHNHVQIALKPCDKIQRDRSGQTVFWLQWAIFVLNVVTTLAVTAAAIIAYNAWQESRSPIAERPFIFIQPELPNAQDWRKGFSLFEWRYHLANYGKSPAVLNFVQANASITDAKPPFSDLPYSDNEYNNLVSPPFIIVRPENLAFGAAVSPGGMSKTYTASGDHAPLLMQGMPDAVRTKRDQLFQATLPSGPVKYWLVGRIEYSDVNGRSFFTNFCLRYDELSGKVVQDGSSDCNSRN